MDAKQLDQDIERLALERNEALKRLVRAYNSLSDKRYAGNSLEPHIAELRNADVAYRSRLEQLGAVSRPRPAPLDGCA